MRFSTPRSVLLAGLLAVLVCLGVVSPAPASAATASTTTVAGPAGAVQPGVYTLTARVLAAGHPVKDARVNVELWDGSRYSTWGSVLTNAEGYGSARFNFPASRRFRAVFGGSATVARSISDSRVVTVADFRQRAVRVAAAQQGDPYRYGATGPDAFDCSGLMIYAFKQVGKSLPRTSREQRAATPRIANSAKAVGDLIFIHSGSTVTHVGLYAGNNSFWVAPKAGDVVKLQKIYTSSYSVGRVS